jgi:hypothetical protein
MPGNEETGYEENDDSESLLLISTRCNTNRTTPKGIAVTMVPVFQSEWW